MRTGRLILIAALLALSPAVARAAPPPIPLEVAAVRKALIDVTELVRAAQLRGMLPRLSDAAAGPLLRIIWDPRLVAPDRKPTRAELAALSSLCVASGQIVFDYLWFRSHGHLELAQPGNALLYQSEIAAGAEFWLRCEAVVIAGIATIVRNLPPEQMNDGVTVDFEGLRHTVFRNHSAMLHMVREGHLRGASVDRLAVALRESAPRLVAAFPVQERQELADVVRQTLPHAGPSARADLDAFIAVLTAP